MVDWLSNAVRSLRTFWHRMAGRVCFRFRRHEAARRHFEQVLLLKGDDFVAYFYLARVAYAAGDNVGYQQRLAMAKRTSPERMARTRYLFDYFEPSSDKDGLFEESGERATWRGGVPPPYQPNSPMTSGFDELQSRSTSSSSG